MQSIDIGSARLACVELGRGEAVILVHGSNSDVRTWQPVHQQLAETHRVVAYSRRFHWPNESIAASADYAMAQHVADLSTLIDTLNSAPVHLVGHSYGALLCLALAIERPARLRSLVLAEPPAIRLFTSNTPTPSEMIKLLLTRPRTAVAIAGLGARGVVPATAALRRGDAAAALGHFGKAVLGREAFDRLSAQRLQQARDNLIPAELLGSGFAPLDLQALRRVETPALLLEGQRSPKLFHHLNDRLAELLPNVQRSRIAGASHIGHEDQPAAWLDAVRGFLGDLACPPGRRVMAGMQRSGQAT